MPVFSLFVSSGEQNYLNQCKEALKILVEKFEMFKFNSWFLEIVEIGIQKASCDLALIYRNNLGKENSWTFITIVYETKKTIFFKQIRHRGLKYLNFWVKSIPWEIGFRECNFLFIYQWFFLTPGALLRLYSLCNYA